MLFNCAKGYGYTSQVVGQVGLHGFYPTNKKFTLAVTWSFRIYLLL